MKKICKEKQKEFNQLLSDIDKLSKEHSELIDSINSLIKKANNIRKEFHENFNELKEFISEITSEQSDYIEGKSEKFTDSEIGQKYTEWHEQWKDIEEQIDDQHNEFEAIPYTEIEEIEKDSDFAINFDVEQITFPDFEP